MKILMILFSLLPSPSINQGHVAKYKAHSISMSIKTSNNIWGDWKPEIEVDILITIDIKNKRIKVFKESTDSYDIIKISAEESDGNGNSIWRMICVDDDASKMEIRILKEMNKEKPIFQLYIYYPKTRIVYDMKEIEN